jgi:hypothetical protein
VATTGEGAARLRPYGGYWAWGLTGAIIDSTVTYGAIARP